MTQVTFDSETERLLADFGFDREVFERLRARLREGERAFQGNVLQKHLLPPSQGDLATLPPAGSEARRELAARGWQAIAEGQVGLVVLAGGMATRFGGAVKAACPVVGERTFLDLKLADVANVARGAGASVPVYLMASFATYEAVRALGEKASGPEVPIETFTQFVSVRLRADGEVFREDDGRPSLYAPGHGDLPFALRASGVLDRFRDRGGRVLFVSNVDNLAATVDPAVIGAHIDSGQELTVEVTAKAPGDRGGAPARVDGRLQIVESFRFPDTFDQDVIPVFNTNSFVLDVAAVDRPFDLTWFAVRKKIGGQEAIQFERLLGEVTAFVPSQFLCVERDGLDGRFQPVKDPEELEQRRDAILRILGARGLV